MLSKRVGRRGRVKSRGHGRSRDAGDFLHRKDGIMASDVPLTRTSPRYLTVAWALLLLLGAFFLFAALSDLAADARTGLPSDHTGTL
jgi:hypothetical protein